MTQRTTWASRFVHAPKQNFTYVTVNEFLRKYPEYESQRVRFEQIAALPDRRCVDCGQFNVWKIVMDKMPTNDMCFTCITGETDASGDYEIQP